jgi:hypothetical protein
LWYLTKHAAKASLTTSSVHFDFQIGDRPLEKTSLKMFELGWRLATFGLFRLAVAALPRMVGRGGGEPFSPFFFGVNCVVGIPRGSEI